MSSNIMTLQCSISHNWTLLSTCSSANFYLVWGWPLWMYVLGTHQTGHASSPNYWQNDFCASWLDISKPDKQWNIEIQLKILRMSKKTKCHSEHLTEPEPEAECPSGAYYTNINAWMDCQSYLISQFLLYKHLVHTANTHMIGFDPKHDLRFFASLWQSHVLLLNHFSALYHSLLPIKALSIMKKIPVNKVLRMLQDMQCIEAVEVFSCWHSLNTSWEDK